MVEALFQSNPMSNHVNYQHPNAAECRSGIRKADHKRKKSPLILVCIGCDPISGHICRLYTTLHYARRKTKQDWLQRTKTKPKSNSIN